MDPVSDADPDFDDTPLLRQKRVVDADPVLTFILENRRFFVDADAKSFELALAQSFIGQMFVHVRPDEEKRHAVATAMT